MGNIDELKTAIDDWVREGRMRYRQSIKANEVDMAAYHNGFILGLQFALIEIDTVFGGDGDGEE